MDLLQAREAYQRLSPRESSRAAVFPHQADLDRYNASPPETQREYLEVMEALLTWGDDWERNTAAPFLQNVPTSPDLLGRLVEVYVTQGRDDSDPLATLLGNSWFMMSDDQFDKLRDVFLRDPGRHLKIAQAVLRHWPSGIAWDVAIRVARTTGDVRVLESVFNAAFAAQRVPDYHAALQGLPEPLLREYASRRRPTEAAEFLRAVGLTP
jgi:hypothetical protein